MTRYRNSWAGADGLVKRAQGVTGVRRLHAVLGGFRLAPYPEEYVGNVIGSLKEIDPDCVIPMHCTDEPFWDIARQKMPGKVLRAYTGTRFVFNGG